MCVCARACVCLSLSGVGVRACAHVRELNADTCPRLCSDVREVDVRVYVSVHTFVR